MSAARSDGCWKLAALLLAAFALCSCQSWGKVMVLVVPPEVSAEGLSDAQLRHRAFASDCVMFLGRQRDDGIALLPHFRVRHSTTSSYLPQEATMSAPLHVSAPLIVDRSAFQRDDLCLFLRGSPNDAWRRMALGPATRRAAAASGRLVLPPIDTLPLLR